MKFLGAISGLLLISLMGQLSSAKETTIIDQDEATFDVERIAQVVCEVTKGADKQISRFSTIQSLIDFFKSISPDHKLAECAHQYLPAFEHIQLILDTANEDVCSDTKISLIESFHRNFVSKARKYRKKQKANQLVAPKLLKLFYMHYASAVSATCARSAVQELQAVQFNKDADSEESGKLVEQLSSTLGKLDASNGYRDMFLVWNFIDSLPVEQDSKLSRYLHEGKTRLYLQMQKSESLLGIQYACRQKLRPFYSLSLLPVIRLADLGFYPEDETLAHMLSENPNHRHLYSVVQLCETVLPLYVMENEKLSAEQLSVLPKDQVASIEPNVDAEEPELLHNPTNKVEDFETIASVESKAFIKRVKSNVDSRVSAQNKILRRMIRKYKSESSGEAGKIVLADNQLDAKDLSSLLEQQLAKTDESAPLSALEGDDDGDEKSGVVSRKKRGVIGSIIRHTIALVVSALLTVVFIAMWVALWVIRIVIVIPMAAIGLFIFCITGLDGNVMEGVGHALEAIWKSKLAFFPADAYKGITG